MPVVSDCVSSATLAGMTTSAIIYTRVSLDVGGTGQSVEQQLERCRAECARNGWPIVDEIEDNDIGASRHTRDSYRPGYERLKHVLQPGMVLVVWEQSRTTRRLAEFADLRDLCADIGAKWSVAGKLYDLTDAADRFALGMGAQYAEYEADLIRNRVVRGIQAHIASGKPSGKLAYGYRRILDPVTGKVRGWEIDEEQAARVRSWADIVLAGGNVYAIVRGLNIAGVPSPTGKKWIPTTMRQLLQRPLYAGLRHYGGKIIQLDIPPMWSVETHDRLVVALASKVPGRQSFGRQSTSLLSAIATCGVCGGRIGFMRAKPHATGKRSKLARYTCADPRSCVGRRADMVDALVVAAVIEFFGSEVGAALLKRQNVADQQVRAFDEVRVLQARLDEAAEQYADGKITGSQLATITERITPRLESAQRVSESTAGTPVIEKMRDKDPREAWEALTLFEQRALVSSLFTIEILRGKPGSARFDPDTVRIVPKKWPTD